MNGSAKPVGRVLVHKQQETIGRALIEQLWAFLVGGELPSSNELPFAAKAA